MDLTKKEERDGRDFNEHPLTHKEMELLEQQLGQLEKTMTTYYIQARAELDRFWLERGEGIKECIACQSREETHKENCPVGTMERLMTEAF